MRGQQAGPPGLALRPLASPALRPQGTFTGTVSLSDHQTQSHVRHPSEAECWPKRPRAASPTAGVGGGTAGTACPGHRSHSRAAAPALQWPGQQGRLPEGARPGRAPPTVQGARARRWAELCAWWMVRQGADREGVRPGSPSGPCQPGLPTSLQNVTKRDSLSPARHAPALLCCGHSQEGLRPLLCHSAPVTRASPS